MSSTLRPPEADSRIAAYLATPRALPPSGVDVSGRAIPLSEGEYRAFAEALRGALDEIDEITDDTDTDATWDSFQRGIDEGRPHRRLFGGMD